MAAAAALTMLGLQVATLVSGKRNEENEATNGTMCRVDENEERKTPPEHGEYKKKS